MSRLSEILQRRIDGTFEVDEWGFDPDLTRLLDRATPLRWSLRTEGAEQIPESGSVLLVIGPRAKVSEPLVVAAAIRRETGRHLRVAGVTSLPFGRPLARRLGGIPAEPLELGALLRTGAVMGVLCARHLPTRPGPGPLDPALLAPALHADVPVLPVAVRGHELGRRWSVRVGPRLGIPDPEGPLAATEMAEAAVLAITAL